MMAFAARSPVRRERCVTPQSLKPIDVVSDSHHLVAQKTTAKGRRRPIVSPGVV